MILLTIHIAFITLPTLSATVRRLHDIGKSGCYIFVGLVPFFGGLTLLVFLCRDSMPEANEFGPPTKYTTNIISQTLQTQAQNYVAPLIPNDNGLSKSCICSTSLLTIMMDDYSNTLSPSLHTQPCLHHRHGLYFR